VIGTPGQKKPIWKIRRTEFKKIQVGIISPDRVCWQWGTANIPARRGIFF
jgi:hypothetical protein